MSQWTCMCRYLFKGAISFSLDIYSSGDFLRCPNGKCLKTWVYIYFKGEWEWWELRCWEPPLGSCQGSRWEAIRAWTRAVAMLLECRGQIKSHFWNRSVGRMLETLWARYWEGIGRRVEGTILGGSVDSNATNQSREHRKKKRCRFGHLHLMIERCCQRQWCIYFRVSDPVSLFYQWENLTYFPTYFLILCLSRRFTAWLCTLRASI